MGVNEGIADEAILTGADEEDPVGTVELGPAGSPEETGLLLGEAGVELGVWDSALGVGVTGEEAGEAGEAGESGWGSLEEEGAAGWDWTTAGTVGEAGGADCSGEDGETAVDNAGLAEEEGDGELLVGELQGGVSNEDEDEDSAGGGRGEERLSPQEGVGGW